MQGEATPTGQWMPAGTPGFLPDFPSPAFDPARARQLLTEAGFPQGFRLTLHAPNDRYPNDAATAQAIGQMWSRVGVATTVEILPGAIYSPRGVHHEYSMGLWGWSNNTAEAGSALINILGTEDAKIGRGVSNVAGYSNPALDALTDRALATLDDGKRAELFRQATRMIADDVALIPLFHIVNPWAGRVGLSYRARADEQTYAVDVHTVK
jgi:peptide/nickel transport system substrate-binding protein